MLAIADPPVIQVYSLETLTIGIGGAKTQPQTLNPFLKGPPQSIPPL
jgi:hypothetical protein